MQCPEPKCREELFKAMNDKCKEIGNEIKGKVSITVLIGCLAVLVAAGGTIGTLAYDAYSGAQGKQDKQLESCQEVTTDLDKKVGIIQNDLDHIREELIKQGKNQDQILKILLDIQRKTRRDRDNDSGYTH